MQKKSSAVPFKDVIDPATIRINPPHTSNPPQTLETVPPDVSSSIITVVRDPSHTLGKRFFLQDGIVSKKASVNVSFGIAVMLRADTVEELASQIKEVGKDPNAAIINAIFDGIDVGEEFVILSGREIENRLGIPRNDRERQKGIHTIIYNGKSYKAVGRFKENVRPSCWQYFDRDIDKNTPEKFRNLSVDEWKAKLAELVPGLAAVSCCRIGSTSARVYHDGQPVGGGNGHLWFKVNDPEDIERFRTAILVVAAKADLTWSKPRHSRKEPVTVVGHSLTTIIDPSVFTPGRLTFIGKPVVSGGLTVEPLSASIHLGIKDSVDTSLVVLPDAQSIRDITRKAGVAMEVSQGEKGLRITTHDLTVDTEIETEDHGVLTLREIIEKGIAGKIRCQTPFRDSSSYAAFVGKGTDGNPFVYDAGTGTTHWLIDPDINKVELIRATRFTNDLLEKAKEDCGAPLEPEALQALKVIKKHNPAEYQRIRAKLKKINPNVSVVVLDTSIKTKSACDASGEDIHETHHGYALDILARFTVDGWPPVGHEGCLYVADPIKKIWVKKATEKIMRLVADTHDGKDHCSRSGDYYGISNHAITLAADDKFFSQAPVGLACPGGFYQIKDNEIKKEPLSPSHRQRVKISVTPEQQETPMFDAFLHETFQSNTEGEEEQQLTLVQEIAGAIMLGIMARHQKAVLFYDPFGRAGKGTLERTLIKLVSSSFVTAVSPFKWGNEYYLASLIGSRFNTVGELPDSKPIPAAAFKTVIGGDLLTGRHPTHRPVSFKNEAAHLFMSNHLITTSDHSEAFYARWLIIEFPNSRLRTGLPIDTGLAERIIRDELPGIAYWALTGAMRLMENGKFSKSIVHDRLMEKWRRNTNSLEEFIHECCDLNSGFSIRRSKLYRIYKGWCKENGRLPFAKGKVKDLLATNIGLGISHTVLDGNEIFRGIQVKADFEKENAYSDWSPARGA